MDCGSRLFCRFLRRNPKDQDCRGHLNLGMDNDLGPSVYFILYCHNLASFQILSAYFVFLDPQFCRFLGSRKSFRPRCASGCCWAPLRRLSFGKHPICAGVEGWKMGEIPTGLTVLFNGVDKECSSMFISKMQIQPHRVIGMAGGWNGAAHFRVIQLFQAKSRWGTLSTDLHLELMRTDLCHCPSLELTLYLWNWYVEGSFQVSSTIKAVGTDSCLLHLVIHHPNRR